MKLQLSFKNVKEALNYTKEKLTTIKLEQHNEKRRCLEMEQVEQLPTIVMWEYVNNK